MKVHIWLADQGQKLALKLSYDLSKDCKKNCFSEKVRNFQFRKQMKENVRIVTNIDFKSSGCWIA